MGIHKVGVQDQGHAIGFNGLRCLTELHVAAREIIIRVTKARFDLDRFEIKLNRTIHIPKFLQCISEIAIRFGKIWINSNTLLVVKNTFTKVSHLEMKGT